MNEMFTLAIPKDIENLQLPNPNHPRLPVAVGSCAGASWRDLHYNLVSEFGLGKKHLTCPARSQYSSTQVGFSYSEICDSSHCWKM